MTKRVQAILENFERLTKAEKKDLTVELVRRTLKRPEQAITDEELILCADKLFLELDKKESAHERSRPRRGLAR